MQLWQKVVLLATAVFLVVTFLVWWTSYGEMELVIINERAMGENESITVNITILTMEKKEVFNGSYQFNGTGSIHIGNITNFLGNYLIVATVGNVSVEQKIKYGKYFEVMEVIVTDEGIEIKNERSCSSCESSSVAPRVPLP